MSDPRSSQNAARLSEDIGDVLSAIRRLIAEDEAVASTHDARDGVGTAIDEDAGDFLARRYGGNSALARRLAGTGEGDAGIYRRPARLAEVIDDDNDRAGNSEPWPLGQLANGPGAARPVPPVPETPMPSVPKPPHRILRHEGATDARAEEDRPVRMQARNDLARSLSAVFRDSDDGLDQDAVDRPREVSASAAPAARQSVEDADCDTTPSAPLRLDATRRVLSEPAPTRAAEPRAVSGWRSWIRPEPPLKRATLPRTHEEMPAPPSSPAVMPAASEDDDGFAEAFEWKARMRPDIAVPAAQAPAGDRAAESGDLSPELAAAGPAAAPAVVSRSGWAVAVDEPDTGTGEAGFADALAALDDASGGTPEDATETNATASMTKRQEAETENTIPPVAHETVTGLAPEAEEQSIRDLLREMIQEELHGELGERFSRNLRAVIRREVAAAIDEYLDRL